MTPLNKNLTPERWREFSLEEQLGNVGSEVHRALLKKDSDPAGYESAFWRALELMDLTIGDPRWRNHRLKELCRVREFITDAYYGGKEYRSTFEDLDRYFFAFALAARLKK